MRRKRNYVNAAVVIPVLALCGVVLACVGYVIHTHSQPMMQYPQPGPEAHVQSGTLSDPAERQAAPDALVAERMLIFSIDATSSMENGSGVVNLLIENPPENGDRFIVTILWEDAGETSFQSGHLGPEQYTGGAPLSAELTTGVYACVVGFDAYRISDNVYTGREAARIMLYARNWRENRYEDKRKGQET